jgi:hypothetical protein
VRKVLLGLKVLESPVVSVYRDRAAKDSITPFFQCPHNGQHFFLMNRVVALCRGELHGVEGNGAGRLPGRTPAQNRTSTAVTGIRSYEDFIISRVLMVNDCQTLSTDNKSFDSCKSILMLLGPFRQFLVEFFVCEGSEHCRMFGKVLQVYSNILHYAEKGPDVVGSLRPGPFQNFLALERACFYATGRDLVSEKLNFILEQDTFLFIKM